MKLNLLVNIGTEMERKLNSIGIYSSEELKDLGSKLTFKMLKAHYPEICLVHLYSLQGAINGVEFNKLSDEMKSELKKNIVIV
ncbi:MAG: hypothetical protein GXZ08_07260 [Tissierellia bacterium]|nr:hypothetical protein [Tissierellia bacterium]